MIYKSVLCALSLLPEHVHVMPPSAVSATFCPLASYTKAWIEVVRCKISTCYIVTSLVKSLIEF
jgi:hypothetical protein